MNGTSIINTLIDANANGYTYIGAARGKFGTNEKRWQITRTTKDSNNEVSAVLFAEGNDHFDKVWDNRLTYTY